MASVGHTAPQWSHPIHHAPLTTSAFLFFISRTKLGQTVTHSPQLIHLLSSTLGGSILRFKNSFPPSNFLFLRALHKYKAGQTLHPHRLRARMSRLWNSQLDFYSAIRIPNSAINVRTHARHHPISSSPYLPIPRSPRLAISHSPHHRYSLTPLKVLRWSSQRPNFSIASRCSFVP